MGVQLGLKLGGRTGCKCDEMRSAVTDEEKGDENRGEEARGGGVCGLLISLAFDGCERRCSSSQRGGACPL